MGIPQSPRDTLTALVLETSRPFGVANRPSWVVSGCHSSTPRRQRSARNDNALHPELPDECLTIRPARLEPRTVMQHHDELAMEVRLQFSDARDVDDRRPMDAHESRWIEQR